MPHEFRMRPDGESVVFELVGDEVVTLAVLDQAEARRVGQWLIGNAVAAAEVVAKQQEARVRIFDGRVEMLKGLVSLGIASFIFALVEVGWIVDRGFAWFAAALVLGAGFVVGRAWGEIQAGKEDLRCAGSR